MSRPVKTMPRIVGTPAEVASAVGAASSSTLKAIAGSSAARGFRLCCTQAVRYLIGSAPVAAATDTYLPANTVEYVQAKLTEKISVIRETADGKVSVTAVDW